MIKIKLFATFFCFSVFFSMQAQSWEFTAPDYEAIEAAISDEKSDFYYPILLARFTEADTTLSLEELRHIYYGYTFQSQYSPYSHSSFLDSIRNLYSKDSLNAADYNALIAYCDSSISEFPFNLDAMSYKMWAYDNISDLLGLGQTMWKRNSTVDVLISSGNGITPETAFYVIKTSHEYYLLDVLGFDFGNKQSLIGECDLLKLADNEYEIEGLYFNVSSCLNSLDKMFKD